MAPHFHDSAVSHQAPSNMPQKGRPPPAIPRVRPAIPLVFGRTKQLEKSVSAAKREQSQSVAVALNRPSSYSPAPETESESEPGPKPSPINHAPLTPDSSPSTQAVAGIVTPPETVSDRVPESEDSKRSVTATSFSTYPPFSPNSDVAGTPTMFGPQYSFSHHPPLHTQAVPGVSSHSVGPNIMHHLAEGGASPNALANGHHSRSHGSNHTSGSHPAQSTSGETMQMPHPLNIAIAAVAVPQPPHGVAQYGQSMDYGSPTAVISPTAWNPAANFFVPPGMPLNGHVISRSASHSSSGHDIHPMIGPLPYPGQMYRPLPVDTIALRHYMTSQFSNREFADFSLKVLHPKRRQSLQGFPVHAVVIARSPTLHSLMRSQSTKQTLGPDGLRVLAIEVTSNFVNPPSILDAVGYLYGLPLPAFEEPSVGLHHRLASNDPSISLRSALSLAGAGLVLQLPDVIGHALGYAATKISWETIDQTLSFVQESLSTSGEPQSKAEQDLKYSLCLPVTNLYLNLERFLVEQFPEEFEFHASVPELSYSRRLPTLHESRPSVSDPRLASIQFGAMPTEQSSHLEFGNLLSSILLSVPTAVLRYILNSPVLGERIGWSKIKSIIQDVVEERERRRLKVIKTRRVVPGATFLQLEETNWEERLEASPESHSGFILTRSREQPAR